MENSTAPVRSVMLVSEIGFRKSRCGIGLYCRTSIGPSSEEAASSATVSAMESRTSTAKPRAVMFCSLSSAANPSSFAWLREKSATRNPSRPNRRATAAPTPVPAPTMAMVDMSLSLRRFRWGLVPTA